MNLPEISQETKTYQVYSWNCPITGEHVESDRKPTYYEDYLSRAGQEKYWNERRERWLQQFRETERYRELQGAVLIEQIPYISDFEDFKDGRYADTSELILQAKSGKKFKVELPGPDEPFLVIKEMK